MYSLVAWDIIFWAPLKLFFLSYVEISEASTVSFGNTPASGACREGFDVLGH